jgi:hypothetical protein
MPPPPLKRWSMTSAFFVRIGREVELELAQRRRIHGANVEIADLPVAQLVHHRAAIVDPARVLQVAEVTAWA